MRWIRNGRFTEKYQGSLDTTGTTDRMSEKTIGAIRCDVERWANEKVGISLGGPPELIVKTLVEGCPEEV